MDVHRIHVELLEDRLAALVAEVESTAGVPLKVRLAKRFWTGIT